MVNSNKNIHLQLIEHVYNEIPAFTDIFTEETFYLTVVCFVITTIAVVFVVSRFVTIKPVE